jgi:hypothetical protein
VTSPDTVQRRVVERFANAVLDGDAAGARALLAHPDEEALLFLVERAARPWRGQHASIRLPARRNGDRWAISYTGTRTRKDGRFERERGDLLVLVAPSGRGARVAFFVFKNVRTRFSTHHDAQLLPSNR